MPTSRGSARRPHRHLIRLIFNLSVFGLAVWFLWSVIEDVGLHAVNRRLLEADLAVVAVILVANVIRFMLLGLRWEIFVRSEAPIGYRPTLSVLMAGNFLGLVAPALRVAGPVLRAFYLSKETGRPRARFYGTIIADQTANFSVFAAAMIFSGILTAARGNTGLSVAAGGSLMFALLGGLYLGRRHLRRLQRGEPSFARRLFRLILRVDPTEMEGPRLAWRFLHWWEHMLEALAGSLVNRGTWWPAIGASALLFVVLAFAQMLAFTAIGAEMTFTRVTFAVATAAFVQILAAAPGGPGVTEASLVLIFLALGVGVEEAAAATFLARLMHYVVLIPWGGFCFFRLQRRYGTARNGNGERVPAEV